MKRNRILNLLMSAILITFVVSCGKSSENTSGENDHEHEVEGEHSHNDEVAEEEVAEEQGNSEIIVSAEDFKSLSENVASSIAKSYLELKDALVASNTEKSKEAASSIITALEGAEASTAVKGLREDAQHIVDTDELEHIREHFDLMSQNVYAMAKVKNTGMTLYKQYCPMAFDNEGAFWLSSSEEIKNPYFGDKMLKCGKVQETIAAK